MVNLEWIKVEDRLPIIPFVGYWSDGKITVFDDESDNVDYAINHPIDKWKPAGLTHWMPLPKPPEK